MHSNAAAADSMPDAASITVSLKHQCMRPSPCLLALSWRSHPRQQQQCCLPCIKLPWGSGSLCRDIPDLFQTRTQPSMEPVASMVPADCQSIHSTTEHLSDSAPECAKTVGTLASPDCGVVDHSKASGSPSLHDKAPRLAMTCWWGICRAIQFCRC